MELELIAIFPMMPRDCSSPYRRMMHFSKWTTRSIGAYRRYVRAGEKRPVGAELFGIKRDGRWAVLFNRQDISNAWSGDVDGVVGYSAETATALVIDVVASTGRLSRGVYESVHIL